MYRIAVPQTHRDKKITTNDKIIDNITYEENSYAKNQIRSVIFISKGWL